MVTIAIVCPNCSKRNYVADCGTGIYPNTCDHCYRKLPMPEEGKEEIVEYGYE